MKKQESNRIVLSSVRMDWETPTDFFDKYNERFKFTLDVCAVPETAKCAKYFTPAQDGLKQDWSKDICWMNPPYGREIGKWIRKAYDESQKGATVVCLVPSRTDTLWWWNYCMKGEIEYVKGRLKFRGKNREGEYVKMNATFANSVVIFTPPLPLVKPAFDHSSGNRTTDKGIMHCFDCGQIL